MPSAEVDRSILGPYITSPTSTTGELAASIAHTQAHHDHNLFVLFRFKILHKRLPSLTAEKYMAS